MGSYIAMDGRTLRSCRQADTLAVLAATEREERDLFLTRLRESRNIFAAVGPASWYLSKMGVVESFRGAGHGRTILNRGIQEGRSRGLTSCILDICAENSAAIELHQSAGFHVTSRSSSPRGDLVYLTMVAPIASVP